MSTRCYACLIRFSVGTRCPPRLSVAEACIGYSLRKPFPAAQPNRFDLGMRIKNIAPPSGRVAASTVPPCCSTNFLTLANPRPIPRGFVVKNGVKSRSRNSGDTPGPQSYTAISSYASDRGDLRVCTRTSDPAGVASIAFCNKFTRARVRCSRSTKIFFVPSSSFTWI